MTGSDSWHPSGLPFTHEFPTGHVPPCLTAVLLLVAIILGNVPAQAGVLHRLPDAIPTPEFVLSGLDGAEHRLSDLRGSVVLVNFWASWCQPCVREIPNLQRLHASYAGEPFEILAVDVEEDENRVRHFVMQHGMTFPVLLDEDGKQFAAWAARCCPRPSSSTPRAWCVTWGLPISNGIPARPAASSMTWWRKRGNNMESLGSDSIDQALYWRINGV